MAPFAYCLTCVAVRAVQHSLRPCPNRVDQRDQRVIDDGPKNRGGSPHEHAGCLRYWAGRWGALPSVRRAAPSGARSHPVRDLRLAREVLRMTQDHVRQLVSAQGI